MILEVILILVLLLANGTLAMAELAIVSARRARLKHMADEGSKGALDALALTENSGQFLSTVQIGITLVGILAGAFGGASLAQSLAVPLATLPAIAPYAEEIAFAIVVLIITYFSLLIGELVPKRIALAQPERLAIMLAPPMRALSNLTAPVVSFLTLSSEFVMRLLNAPTVSEQTVTEEEVKIMIDEGTASGVFELSEQEMVGRVFRLSDLHVNALMTPRTEIHSLDLQDSPETIRQKLLAHNHARFPVTNGSIEELIGIVRAKDLLAQYLEGKPIRLRELTLPVVYVPESLPALDLLEKLRVERTSMAMVIDEYGGIQGLVTLNDLMDAIVGDVPFVDGETEAEIVQREDGSFFIDGRVPTHEFQDKLGIRSLPDVAEGYYQTVGGLVMAALGRIPKAGDYFDWDGWRIEVVDMDGRRVDKVLLGRSPQPDSSA